VSSPASTGPAALPAEIVEQFFESLRLGPPGGRWQFLIPQSAFGFELYVDFDRMRETSLRVMRHFDAALSGERVEDVSARMKRCLLEHMKSTRMDETLFNAFTARVYKSGYTLRDVAHPAQLAAYSQILHDELSRLSSLSIFLRPIWKWCPPEPTITDQVVWVTGNYDLNELVKRLGHDRPNYLTAIFPPVKRWDGRKTPLTEADSWIGTYARSVVEGESVLKRVRGALSFAVEAPQSRMFSAAQLQGGQIIIDRDSWTISFPESLVPPLLTQPQITPEMLNMLRGALVGGANNQRLQVALEYAAAGWEPRGRLGYLHNAIALDALFGVRGKVGASIKAGLERTAGKVPDIGKRADLLYDIRNELMHGQAASIESCSKYLDYVEQFHVDPAADQLAILRECIWRISLGEAE